MIRITDNQRALILLAVQTGGRIEQYPDNLKGGARTAVTRSLVLNDLIVADGAGYALTAAGYEAAGLPPPHGDADAAIEDAASSADEADEGVQNAANGDGTPAGDGSDGANIESDSDGNEGGTDAGGSESDASTPPKPRKATRIDQVVALMQRAQGVTIKEVMEATGWQQHSVRGFFAGTLKKKGYTVTNEKIDKQDRVYRIAVEEANDASSPAAEASGGEEE